MARTILPLTLTAAQLLACGPSTSIATAPATEDALNSPPDARSPDTLSPPDAVADVALADAVADAVPDVPPVNCPKDTVSPNQSQATARTITARGDFEGLVVCRGSDDWFRVDLAAGYAIAFDVCTPSGAPTPLLEFFREEFPAPEFYL